MNRVRGGTLGDDDRVRQHLAAMNVVRRLAIDHTGPIPPAVAEAIRHASVASFHDMSPEEQRLARQIMTSDHSTIRRLVRGGSLGPFLWGMTHRYAPLIAGATAASFSGPGAGVAASIGTRIGLDVLDELRRGD